MEQQADRRLTDADFRNCKKYTRNSTEMLEIRMKPGLAGYAVAVMLLEKIEESNNREVKETTMLSDLNFAQTLQPLKRW